MKRLFFLLFTVIILFCCACVCVSAAPAEPQGFLPGDVTADGAVTAADARAILRACVSLEPIRPDLLPLADADGDGHVAAADARKALRLAVRLENASERHAYQVTELAAASCTAKGKLSFRCVLCGKEGTMEHPALGHRFGAPAVSPATCSAQGESAQTCEACGYQSVESLPKLPHTWKAAGDTVACATCGEKANGFTVAGKNTYYCKNGAVQHGWCEINGAYYFTNRTDGKLLRGGTADGIPLGADGKAPADAVTVEKIRTFIKAKKIVASVTDPADTVAQKKEKAFRWVMRWPYRQYRQVGAAMKTPGFEALFANDIFDRHNGCCGSVSYAFAFLAVECGCKAVYVCDDGVSAGGHAWVTMEGNNRVYDVIFAKARGFENNYDANVPDYRRGAPRRTYVGG